MDKLKIFQDKQVRSYWDQDKELWFFSIINVIAKMITTNCSASDKFSRKSIYMI